MTTADGDAGTTPWPDPAGFRTPADWGAGLAQLRERAGLSVRDLARASGARPSTVGGYVAGRHLPTPSATDTVRALLAACGLTTDAEQAPWLDALIRLRRTPGARVDDGAAPYKGLAGYDVGDATWFCGRERLTAALVERAVADPSGPLLLVGASGSGKSSILRAGLAATLRQQGWSLAALTPGTDPDATLRDATGLARDLTVDGGRVLLVVDQLEELWTGGGADDTWRSAVDRLVDLAAQPRVVVAAALRADFYAHALACESLADALQDHQVVVGPMSRQELVRAVREPAERAGVALEPGLVDVLLADLAPRGARGDGDAYEAGALPLLSFALLQTWQRHSGRMAVADYIHSGGIAGAVASAAEQVYAGLRERERLLARRLFTRLVAVGEDTGDARRRVGHDELDALEPADPGPGIADVVERFVAARLLTADDRHVEITHEALLVAWPRLRAWLDEDRAGLAVQRTLAENAAAWQRSGRDGDLLLRGTRLEAAREWASRADRVAALTADERDFVEQSERAATRRQQAARRRTRRLQLLSAGLAAGLVVVAALTAYAQTLRAGAERQRDLALSRHLAEAANRLREVDPSVAARFALLGYRTSPTVEARSALLDATALPLARRLDGPGGIASVAVSRNGHLMAAIGDAGLLRLWRVPDGGPDDVTPERTATVDASADPEQRALYAVAVDATARRVATGGLGGAVRVWDTTDPGRPAPVARLDTRGLTVLALAVNPAGVLAAALTGSDPDGVADGQVGRVALWSLAGDGAVALGEPLDFGTTVHAVAFDAGGTVLAVGGGDGTVHRLRVGVDGADGSIGPVLAGPTAEVTSIGFSPDGSALAAGSKDLMTHVWRLGEADGAPEPLDPDAPDRTDRRLEGAQSWVNAVSFSPDGAELVTGSSDSRLRIYEADTYASLAVVGNPGPVTAVVHTTDGTTLLSAGADGAVRMTPRPFPVAGIAGGRTFALAYTDPWHLIGVNSTAARVFDVARPFVAAPSSDNLSAPQGDGEQGFAGTMAVHRDRGLLALGGRAGATWVYGAGGGSGPVLDAAAPRSQSGIVQSAAFVAGGRAVVAGADDATLSVTDVSDPVHPVALGEPVELGGVVYAMASTPDGDLLATGTGTSGLIQLWDASDPAALRKVADAPADGAPTLQVYAMSFTADGGTLAVGSADRTVRFLDVHDPASPRWTGTPVTGAGDYVWGVQFGAHGTRLATASGDGVVRIYQVTGPSTVRAYAVLGAAGSQRLYSVALRPDGEQVSAAGAAPNILTWTLDADAAARRVCALAGDPVPDEEWSRYLPSVAPQDPCAGDGG